VIAALCEKAKFWSKTMETKRNLGANLRFKIMVDKI